jgi:hypothetical protein
MGEVRARDHSRPAKPKATAQPVTGNRYLARVLGEAAVWAGRTDTFLGARYRRIARRRGKKKAIVAVGRSMLVIIWHLLADPDTRFLELGSDHSDHQVNTLAKRRNHVRQLEALGYRVTFEGRIPTRWSPTRSDPPFIPVEAWSSPAGSLHHIYCLRGYCQFCGLPDSSGSSGLA